MINPPDYQHWCQRDLWEIRHGIQLLLGIDPVENPKSSFGYSGYRGGAPKLLAEYEASMTIACDAMDIGTLKPFGRFEGRKICENRRVYPADFLKWAQGKGFKIPDEFVHLLDSENPKVDNFAHPTIEPEKKLRASQKAKAACQGIAKTVWDTNPDMTIADMLKTKEIQDFGGAGHYTDKAVRGWLSEVDPRPPEKKTGRPRK